VTNEIEQPGGDPALARRSESRDGLGTHAPELAGGTAEDLTVTEAAVELPGPAVYAAADRPRGLNAYFAPGGEDEATDERRADERRNLRLLLLMVAALVLIPTLLTIAALVQELIARRGG
jgi:hypothetical protein